ncbi:MAG TPA: sigma-70 family RNA polymerase sigma factor [Candidatus Udaeobacter sp.]|nr:sigma-70 family RNA polymerase sigma factor [Candidatus Udaeobacter sp.]
MVEPRAAGESKAPEGPPDSPPLRAGSPADLEAARDRAWVARARAGDGAAFEALVRTYATLVHRVIGRLAADPDDCADLVQETFLRAWQGLPGFVPNAPFRPWLLAIALNAARDAGRRRRRRPASTPLLFETDEGEVGVAGALADPDPTPAERLEGEDLRRRAEAAFKRLAPDAQAVLWLRVREDLSYDEIATVLGIPRGTVMSRLARAREALRVHLEEETG